MFALSICPAEATIWQMLRRCLLLCVANPAGTDQSVGHNAAVKFVDVPKAAECRETVRMSDCVDGESLDARSRAIPGNAKRSASFSIQ